MAQGLKNSVEIVKYALLPDYQQNLTFNCNTWVQ